MSRQKALSGITAAAAVALLATGCLSSGSSSNTSSGSGGGSTSGGSSASPGATGKKTVEILGAFAADEATAFRDSLKDFESTSGITVKYTPSSDFTTLVRSRVAANNVPDIAIFPQPGLLADIAKTGKLADLSTVIDINSVKADLIPGFIDAATIGGKVYGAPMRMAVKSLVWVPVPAFQQAGYTAPKTQAELLALTDKIKASGTAPWCFGMGSGPATGWVATDWLEDYVLRDAGPAVYDQWVKHTIPFNDPRIKQAALDFEKIFAPDGNVLGGRKSISSTPFQTAGNPMFNKPPKCFMQKQGNFIASPGFYPKAVQKAIDANVTTFPFPGNTAEAPPVLLGGDIAAAFNKSAQDPSVKKVMEFISSEKFGGPWAKAGGWISPRKSFDATNYPDNVTKTIVKGAFAAKVGRYDASDSMPGAVGSGSFWKGMVAYVSGQKNLDQVLNDIEKSWPKN